MRVPGLAFIIGASFSVGLSPSPASAHPGGLNSEGCHNNRKTGGYHCHRGSASSASQALRAVSTNSRREFANCSQARAAGAAPVRAGDPGYGGHLDATATELAANEAGPVRVSVVLPMFESSEPLTLVTPVTVSAGAAFTCTPVAVWDGDGPIWCAEGPKIRIAGVAAREMDGRCSPGQPCPAVNAIEARDRLVRLLGGARGAHSEGHVKVRAAPMRCSSDGSAGGSRTAAWCTSPEFGDLSCAVVRAGGAVRWSRYWGDHRC